MDGGVIDSLIEKEVLSPVDLYFAKSIVSEETPAKLLISYLFMTARQGHLCVTVDKKSVVPDPSLFSSDPKEADFLRTRIIEGFDSITEDLFEDILEENLIPSFPLCRFKKRLYLRKNWLLEKNFKVQIARLQRSSPYLTVSSAEPSSLLNTLQATALEKALSSSLSVISGGPGTGKTFTAIEIVRSFIAALTEDQKTRVKIKLAAPTGKAAALLEKNMAMKLGSPGCVTCGTLHSFLEVGFYESNFQKSLFADLLLIDEASMLDAKLFVRLLTNLQEGGRVILMGDKDQLPPVEAGGFFSDVIDRCRDFGVPVTLLRKSIRAETTDVQDLSDAILSADIERVRKQKGVLLLSSLRASELKTLLEEKVQAHFSFPYNPEFNPEEILRKMEQFRILSPIRKGPLGIEEINQRILTGFLETRFDSDKIICPILITENDSSHDLMNGDTGILVGSISSFKKGVFGSEDTAYFFSKKEIGKIRELPATILPLFSLAYALSVHKSQGSEYESILVVVPPGSEKFGKEVLYTAVTRAKKEILLVSEKHTLEALLGKSSRKISGLSDLVKRSENI